MKTTFLFLLSLLGMFAQLNAQAGIEYLWSDPFVGPGEANIDDVSRDQFGNVYIIGRMSGTVDFNPAAGVANESATGNSDLFFAKYDSSGNFVWVKQIDMGYTGWGVAACKIKVKNNRIYIGGTFLGSADFDPGAGVATVTATGNLGPYFGCYDLSGNYIWVKTVGSANNDHTMDLEVDNSGNLYIGFVCGGVSTDFDPGPGVVSVPVFTNDAVFTKYDASGNLVFAKSMLSTYGGWHPVLNITVDNASNIYIAGFTDGNTDIDPGAGVVNVTSTGLSTSYVARYDNMGNYVWHGVYNGAQVTAIKVNTLNNALYTCGLYNAPNVDMDFSAVVQNVTNSGNYDGFMARYDLAGGYVWSYKMGGPNDDYYRDIDFYRGSQLVAVANFQSANVDFDPDAGITNYSSNGQYDFAVTRYDFVNPNLFNSIAIGSTLDDFTAAINTNVPHQSINVVGQFNNVVDFDGMAPVQNEASVGQDGFLAAYRPIYSQSVSAYYGNGTPVDTSLSFTPFCYGDSVILTSTADMGATIFWFDQLGNQLGTGSPFTYGPLTTTMTFTAVDSIVGASSEDYWGYSQSITIPLTQVMVDLTVSDDSICPGTSVDLLAHATVIPSYLTDSIIFSWNPALGNDSMYTVTPTTDTTYWVYVDYFGCSDSDFVDVTILNAPVISITASDTLLCASGNVTLTASGANNYSWSGGITNGVAFTPPAGINTYTVIGTNGVACFDGDTASIVVSVSSAPIIVMPNDTVVCGAVSILINPSVSGGTVPYTYLWNDGTTASSDLATASGIYSLIVTDHLGCADTGSTQITISSMLNPLISMVPDTSICDLTDILLIPVISGGTGSYTYMWNDHSTNPTLDVVSPGTYFLNVIDSIGCGSSDTIEVTANCPLFLYLPNSFTPNGDGINDFFMAYGHNVAEFRMEIYDRFGELIYTSDSMAKGWNGGYKNIAAPQAVYVYKVNYQGYDGQTKELRGKVQLIR
jgi:gliding motility-associated-like protein